MSKVFVVDTYQRSLDPVHPGRARLLLNQGKAAVWRRFPFTIILRKEVEHPQVQPLRLKLDPGSKTTGIALVNDASGEVVFAADLSHRGQQMKKDLETRRGARRGRRARKTRYRKPRLQNRRRRQGWMAPSLESRVHNIMTWVQRLSRYAPVQSISQELVRFDMQVLENPAIEGKEYQQGTLAGYETREFLLENGTDNALIATQPRHRFRSSTSYLVPKEEPTGSAISHSPVKSATPPKAHKILPCS